VVSSATPAWAVVAVISEFFVQLGAGFAAWVVGLFPDWDVPAEITGFDDTLNGFVANFGGVGVWAPWVLVITCAGISVAAWVIGLAVKSLRAAASHIPMVGGAG